MTRNRFFVSIAGAATSALLLTGCGGLGDEDRQQAGDAALAAVGEGRVTEVDDGDDDQTAAYVVEVSLDTGESIDVELDDSFAVLNQGEIDNELAQQGGGDAGGTPSPTDQATPSPTASAPTSPNVDDDTPLEGEIKERAEQTALAEVGSGRVTESTFADPDEAHAYEVEIDDVAGDDDDVTVELDEDFNVVRVDR